MWFARTVSQPEDSRFLTDSLSCGLLPPVQPPQRCFGVDAFADAVDVEGVVLIVPRQRTIAVRAKTVARRLPAMHVDAQAGVRIRVKRAEIHRAPSGRAGAVGAQQRRKILRLIEAVDRDTGAVASFGTGRRIGPGC